MPAPPRRSWYSFSVKRLLVLVAVCALVLGAWNWLFRKPTVTISGADVAKKQTFILKPRTSSTYGIHFRVFGRLDGQATIVGPNGPIIVGPGSFDVLSGGDFYDDQLQVTYAPGTVTSGNVTIEYEFGCL